MQGIITTSSTQVQFFFVSRRIITITYSPTNMQPAIACPLRIVSIVNRVGPMFNIKQGL